MKWCLGHALCLDYSFAQGGSVDSLYVSTASEKKHLPWISAPHNDWHEHAGHQGVTGD